MSWSPFAMVTSTRKSDFYEETTVKIAVAEDKMYCYRAAERFSASKSLVSK